MKKLKFFNLQDFLLSVVPGLLTYHSTIRELEFWLAVISGFLVLLLFVLLIIKNNIGVYKKDLAEILAHGYYINFLENLSLNLVELKNEIEFGNKEIDFYDLDAISVEIIIPQSISRLEEVADHLNDSKKLERLNLRNRDNNSGFWARGVRDGEKLIITDFPRTLFSLPKYLENELGESYSENKSEKYHRIFKEKIESLILDNRQNRKLAKFKITEA